MKESVAITAVERVARALRIEAMKCPEGTLIGSEESLVSRFGVSRPTLRQAAAMVAQEQLLVMKRGVGGGYFSHHPNSKAVSHMTAIYLRTHDASREELITAVEAIRVELVRLASRNRSQEAIQAMQDFLDREKERSGKSFHYRDFLKGERDFGHTIGVISQNKVLSLFLDILYDFTSLLSREEDIYVNRPARITEYRDLRNRLAEAIFSGDEELAVLMAKRCAETSTQWMLEDAAAKPAKKARTAKKPKAAATKS